MTILTAPELEGLRRIGRIVGQTLALLEARAAAGMTTLELDQFTAGELAAQGARPTPRFEYGFPGTLCISVNDVAVHGIPGHLVLRPGDLVKFDLTADRDGFIADATRMVLIPPVSNNCRRLADCARAAFDKGAAAATAGRPISDIGRAVEAEVLRCGFNVIRELQGHGVGRQIHEAPNIPNFYQPQASQPLTEGMVITIEPIIAAGNGFAKQGGDGWAVRTADGSLSAHYEETIVITKGQPVIVTAA